MNIFHITQIEMDNDTFINDFNNYKVSLELIPIVNTVESIAHLHNLFEEQKAVCIGSAEYFGLLEKLEDEFIEFLSERHPDKVLKFEELQKRIMK
jgi:hypothetical protein